MICNRCKYKDECGYYEETIEPIDKAILFGFGIGDFESRIKEALEDFECEDFSE